MLRKVEVVPYNAEWPTLFQQEATNLATIFGPEVVAIHHIGSTSVPRLWAKPIIDVMMEVHDVERLDAFSFQVIELGYIPKGEFGVVGRRFYIKGSELHRTHHIHAYATGHPEIELHLSFRDYLRAHNDEVQRYSQLKDDLARQFPTDMAGYMAGKDAFLKEMVRKATAWREQG